MNLCHAVAINLDRRPDRWEAFTRRWADVGTPVAVQRFPAVDTGDAAGCLASHRTVLAAHTGPVLVLEDDACFRPSFTLDLTPPSEDWQILWLGGQHYALPGWAGRGWVAVRGILRTHAYIARHPQQLARALMLAPRLDPYLFLTPGPQYCVWPHTVGQAGDISDIDGLVRDHDTYWSPAWH